MIRKNYSKKVTIERTAETVEDGVIKSDYEVVFEDIPCHIQPLTNDTTQDLPSSFGKNWLMFCDVNDIREGDRVKDGDSEYRVTGVESYEWRGKSKHMEIVLRKW